MSFSNPFALVFLLFASAIIGAAIYILSRRNRTSLSRSKLTGVRITTRSLALFFLILALADPYLESVVESSDLLLLTDISDSVDQSQAEALLEQASQYAAPGTRLQILPFAGKAAPVPFPHDMFSSFSSLKSAWTKLDIGHTDLEASLAQAISTQSGSVLLVSDGYETKGDFRAILGQLKNSDLRVFPIVPKNSVAPSQFRISKLHAPLVATAEKSVEIRVSVNNSSAETQSGVLEITHDGKSLEKKEISVAPNSEALFIVNSDPSKEGIKEVTATLIPSTKEFASSAETVFISGAGKEKVLLISANEEDGYFLKQVLSDQAYRLSEITQPSQSTKFADLTEFSSVILNNTALKFLPSNFPKDLESYTKEGGGVVLIGGNQSFGLGGYIDTPIETISPLKFVPPQTEKKRLNVAVSLVLDKSHSMRDGNKISFVKDAARAVIQNLKPEDYVQVIGFDELPFVAVKMSRLSENREIALDRVDRLYPAGRTNPLPAMDEARRAMSQVQAGRKHVIIMTDGKIPAAGLYYIGVVNQLRAAGATVSTVLLGSETDTEQLRAIANAGGGAFYQTTDANSLPKIFVSDVKVATGEKTQKENREYQVRNGTSDKRSTTIASFPSLFGYVQTKSKPNAELELVAYADAQAEPLLASWNYGKGKVVAFTSDVNGRWSQRWVEWPSFRRFWGEIVDGLRSKKGKGEESTRFDLRYFVEKGALKLDLSVFSDDLQGAALAELKTPDGRVEKFEFGSVSRGHYLATLPNASAGKHELNIKVGVTKLTPVAFNISGELFGERKGQGFNLAVLESLAGESSGKVNPSLSDLRAETFSRTEKHPLFSYLILLATILFLFEIIVRELKQIPLLRLGRWILPQIRRS